MGQSKIKWLISVIVRNKIKIILFFAIALIVLGMSIYINDLSNNNENDNDNNYEEIRFGYLGLKPAYFDLLSYSYEEESDDEFEGLSFNTPAVFSEKENPNLYYWYDICVLYKNFDNYIDLNKYLRKIKMKHFLSKRKKFKIDGKTVIRYKYVDKSTDDDCSDDSECVVRYYNYDYYLIINNSVYYFNFSFLDPDEGKDTVKILEKQIDNFINSIKIYKDFYNIKKYKIELEKQKEKERAENTEYLIGNDDYSNFYRYKYLSYSIAREFDEEQKNRDDTVYIDNLTDRERCRLNIYYYDKNSSSDYSRDLKYSIDNSEKIQSEDEYDVFYYSKDYEHYSIYSFIVSDYENYYYEIQLEVFWYHSDSDYNKTKNDELYNLAKKFKDSISIKKMCSNLCDNQTCNCEN